MSIVLLENLFPVPSPSPSTLSPSHFPGVSPQSTEALQNVLKDNHRKWHIFFNEKRFHNHAAHRAIASWALGADASTIQSKYEKDCGYEKPAFESPEAITAENFNEHLGDDKYFNAYMQFFTAYLKDNEISTALEEFVFSRKANLGLNSSNASLPADKQPLMLSRFLSGLLHPMIHTGYGAEFNLPGMVVEGLAQTAVHLCPPNLLTHLSLFADADDRFTRITTAVSETIGNTFNATASFVDSALDNVLPSTLHDANEAVPHYMAEKHEAKGVGIPHALSILARVLSDPRFAPSSKSSQKDEVNLFEETVEKHGGALASYVNEWDLRARMSTRRSKSWLGLSYNDDEYPNFNADFFFMHLVTSSIFLPALCALLSPVSQVDENIGYLDEDGEEARTHHDEHVTKIIRSLVGWGGAFGTKKARVCPPAKATELGKAGSGRNVTEEEAESAGFGMGLGFTGASESTSAKAAEVEEEGPGEEAGGEQQGKDADLHPRAWRDSKNGVASSYGRGWWAEGVGPRAVRGPVATGAEDFVQDEGPFYSAPHGPPTSKMRATMPMLFPQQTWLGQSILTEGCS
ncbi:hypothetical protein BDZ97DRAFT_1917776 [Flammula alnicola]|nr:hypothetical protein BDZ97DRAFT_1917776 [Flammula alnicola]